MTDGRCGREREVRQVGRGVAHYGALLVRLTGRAGAELYQNLRLHEAVAIEQWFVGDMQTVPLGTYPDTETGPGELLRDLRPGLLPDPGRQPLADHPRPAPFLAARGRKGISARAGLPGPVR